MARTIRKSGERMPLLDREHMRRHHVEFSYLTGRFMVDHLVRVHQAFDGDVIAAIVLGTIGQYNARRFFDEIAPKSEEPVCDLLARGEHIPYLRPCNAMSVSASTGIPRETVRRKIRWLIDRGWVQQVGRDKLFVTRATATHFADFDVETVDRFHAAAMQMVMTLQKRMAKAPKAAAAGASATTASSGSAPGASATTVSSGSARGAPVGATTLRR
jgi:hypothetical protein